MTFRLRSALWISSLLGAALSAAESEVVSLSPFVVSTEGDEGYRAANTLSGTRMNASLIHTPAAVSVLTKEFLDDIGAENVFDMLKFAMSTEHERNDPAGGVQQAFDVRATIRGFTESVISRDYLPNMVEGRGILASDRFNVERADVSRGPNSILFGAGRPGGALNLTTKRAHLNGRRQSVTMTVGNFARKRSEVDFAFPLIRDKLALRTNALWEDREGWFEFEMARQKGVAVAGTYQPFKHTQIRAGVERLVRDQVMGGNFPHADFGYSRWVMGGAPRAGNPLLPGTNPAPALLRSTNTVQVIFAPQIRAQPFRVSTTGADMRPDLPGTQGTGFWETISGAAAPSGGTVDDPFYGKVIPANAYLPGPGRDANYHYTIYSVFLDQRIGGVNFEVGFNRTNYYRGFTQPSANAVGDPNPVLPGAYYADGDSAIAAGRNPGTLLPDIARANPFVGLPYVQSQVTQQIFDQRSESIRASIGYELDLTKRHAWFGRHSLAASWQHNDNVFGNGTVGEYNLAPGNSQLIDSTTNVIFRRTYLDFWSPGGQRGALDPWSNPVPDGPGMKARFIWNNSYPWNQTVSKSLMFATQSRFPGDKIVLTAGYRRERIENNNASLGGERLPNSTNLWITRPYLYDPATIAAYSGATKTFGAVVMPLPWLGFSYNQSQSVFPQSNFTDIYDRLLVPSKGEGKDYAVRLNLLGGRLYATLSTYRNLGRDQFHDVTSNTVRGQGIPVLNDVLTTLLRTGRPLPATLNTLGITQVGLSKYRETVTSDGRGSEIEITGRLAPGWSLSLNYARPEITFTDMAPSMAGFLAETKAAWDGNLSPLDSTRATVATFVRARDGTPSRDFVLNPATINDAYDYVMSLLETVYRGTGKPPLSFVGESFNLFSSYRFTDGAPMVLRGARVGGGANYRGPAVIGYDEARNNEPILGRSTMIYNAMLGKTVRVRRGQTLDLQLNLENLFRQEDLIPYSAAAPGQVVRYLLPRVRHGWSVRATYSF
ncbi:MAG: TonB-dependent receptor plug domain-containing protein [Verrucomicrobia bacterium]|nr:TonB-dependent receptor plug domain-containing protein [Verrucomicrobiota bacterium]